MQTRIQFHPLWIKRLTSKTSSIKVLTLDLSFRNTGYNVSKVYYDTVIPKQEFTFKTKPEAGAKEQVVENIVLNFLKLQKEIDHVLEKHDDISLILIEFPFTSQNSKAAVLQGLCYGLIAGLAGYTGGPSIVLVHPNDVKKWCCNRIKNCDKSDIQRKALQYFPDLLELKADEHVVDSYVILLSQLEQPNLKLSRYLSL